MSDLPLLYIADPDAAFGSPLVDALSKDFQAQHFADGMSCIAQISEQRPAILLLSAHLPDMAAHELCREMRQDGHLHDTHVVLVLPADATSEAIDDAHAAGCDEVLLHPVDFTKLAQQLRSTYRLASERSAFRQQANYAQQVAMTAMTSMGELGVVLQFLSKCFACASFKDVGEALIGSLNQYSLSGAVQIRAPEQRILETTSGDAHTDEAQIIEKLHGIGRIFELKNRMVINYPHVSILLNATPEDHSVRGRIRDNVAMLAEGGEARVNALIIEQDNRRKQNGIRFALSEILDMTAELRSQQRERQEQGQRAVNEVIANVESAFVHFGLSSAQEHELIALLVNLRQEVASIGMSAEEIDQKLQRVVRSLRSIANEKF